MKIFQRFSLGLVVAAWLILGCLQLQTALRQRSLLPALLAAESILVGYRLLSRRTDKDNPYPWYVRAGILGSVFLAPLMLRIENPVPLLGTVVACVGVSLTLWALWTLGASFGIAPADRGLVTRGPYRYIRHPMYAGALLNTLPAVIWNPSLWNLALLALIVAIDIVRIHLEERTIFAYDQYTQRVRWRVIPFIW